MRKYLSDDDKKQARANIAKYRGIVGEEMKNPPHLRDQELIDGNELAAGFLEESLELGYVDTGEN